MCLTLANAATIHYHTGPAGTAIRGYAATARHSGHLTPGDQWRPFATSRRGPSPTSTAGTA